MHGITNAGGVTAAVWEMRLLDEQGRLRSWQQRRYDRAIHTLDQLIEDIEQLNLADRSRVPLAWAPSLARLAAQLPVECADRLRAGISPQRLLDQVYDIQQEVFWLKQGMDPADLASAREELPAVS
ncbi:MAG: hypothetical protein WAM30_14855 [Candidatus Dormiibacterota bacterium]